MLIYTLNRGGRICACQPRSTGEGEGFWDEGGENRRTIPDMIARYFSTLISLANFCSSVSKNEPVEAAGLSETATTTPFRQTGEEDILRLQGRRRDTAGAEEEGEGRVRSGLVLPS